MDPPQQPIDIREIYSIYVSSLKTVRAWLAWHGSGSPGPEEPTYIFLVLADKAYQAGSQPGEEQMQALEIAIECRKIMERCWKEQRRLGAEVPETYGRYV